MTLDGRDKPQEGQVSGLAGAPEPGDSFLGTEAVEAGIFGRILSLYVSQTKWCTLYKDMKVLVHLHLFLAYFLVLLSEMDSHS